MIRLWKAGALSAACAVLLSAWSGSSAIAQGLPGSFPTVADAIHSASKSFVYSDDQLPAPTLAELVDSRMEGKALDAQGRCLATAIYFESMGEKLEGQLAVADVVINRAKSSLYPSTWCGVVRQRGQFSFVRNGRFPRIDTQSVEWRRARAVARVAAHKLASVLPSDVMWYHADYVAPKWRRNLTRVDQIGAHIFYRS